MRANDGYNYKPMEKANIGVAIGYKDILVNNTTYRLFVFAARGGGYEEEWAVNMRVGTEGDATGFQEARDGAIGFIMPYIKEHTDGLDGNVNVSADDEGMKNDGKTFVGWNTEADGSGMWFANGSQATLEQLDLGDRAQYTQDLQELADLQAEEAPAYNTEEDEWTAADEREAMLEAKYTADLYAQWVTPTTPPAPNPTPSTSSTTTNAARAATPHTGDTMSMQVAMLVLLAAGVSLCGARRLRRLR